MDLFRYEITLLDAMYYAREGLNGAVTPPFLHGTAINGALAAAMNYAPENQPLLVSDLNGGRNRPRYTNSRLCDGFYATPASVSGALTHRTEIAKGENDGYLDIHKRNPNNELKRIDFQAQPLRYCRLQFIAPETRFVGYLFLYDMTLHLPERIRLGSFRSPARIAWRKADGWRRNDHRIAVRHPVDPLLVRIERGVFVNMLPYGIVINAIVPAAYEARFGGRAHPVAIHAPFRVLADVREEVTRVKAALRAADPETVTSQDRAVLLLDALRTSVALRLYVAKALVDDNFDDALQEIGEFTALRQAVALRKGVSDDIAASVRAECETILNELDGIAPAPQIRHGQGGAIV